VRLSAFGNVKNLQTSWSGRLAGGGSRLCFSRACQFAGAKTAEGRRGVTRYMIWWALSPRGSILVPIPRGERTVPRRRAEVSGAVSGRR
jgi:hypothetical protein